MSFWRNYYHIVWATKNREPLIQPAIEPALHAYLVNKGRELGIITYAINGWVDHVHLVVSIPPKLSVAAAVKRLKGASSHYVKQILRPADVSFAWQRGYGCFTLGERQRAIAEAYVREQKQHHAEQSTNRWLEMETHLDEGPPNNGLPADGIPRSVHEPQAAYVADDFPF